MKVGDIVQYAPHGCPSDLWQEWYGTVIRCVSGTDARKVVVWFRDNNVQTTNKESDLKVISEGG